MSKKFLSVITAAGAEKLAAAFVSGDRVNFVEMSVGDGNGVIPGQMRARPRW